MKQIARKLFTPMLAIVLCLAASCGTDYSTWNYGDYDAVADSYTAPEGTEGYWDYWETKDIAYQFVYDSTGAENDSIAGKFPILLDLFEDGTAKAWETCLHFMYYTDVNPMVGKTDEQTSYNAGHELYALFYGYWVTDSATNTAMLYVQNSIDYETDGDEVQYKSYSIDMTPSDGKISFYIDATYNGRTIKSLLTSNLEIQYSSFHNFYFHRCIEGSCFY